MPIATMADANEWIYSMQPGDNLWNVSREYLADVQNWRKLKTLNNIRKHRSITPGTQLRIPIAWLKVKPLTVRVLSLMGDVSASSSKPKQGIAIAPDTRLSAGDEVRTGADGSVLLEFADGSRLLLQRNSQLLLEVTNAYGSKASVIDNRIRLDSGRIESEVPTENNPKGRFEIRTPAATTAVRGTRYRVSAEGAVPVSRIEVIEGEVNVSAAGKTMMVLGGYGTVVTRDQAPQVPIPLLEAPELSLLPSKVEGLPYQLEWPPLAEAKAYRIQLHPADDPGSLLVDETRENPQYQVSHTEDGAYLLAVRGIDANALEGLAAQHRLSLRRVPEPAHSIPLSESMTNALEQPTGSSLSSHAALNTQGFLYLIPLFVMLLLFIPALFVLLI
jgi:hypothetical protein